MKKIVVSILATLYLCSSAGAAVHLHYCMGEVIGWSFSEEKDKCQQCGMKVDGNCCKDEQKFIKNNADQKLAESAIHFFSIESVASPVFVNITEHYSSSLIEEYPISHAPPNSSGTDILIRNCVFRI